MKESALQYVWQHKLFVQQNLMTTDGQSVNVIDVGRLNSGGGPDFFNAKIKLGNTLWAGNVEVHINSSDWYRHHHQYDDAYANVVLHVVKKADQDVYIHGDRKLPQLELVYPETVENSLSELESGTGRLPCMSYLSDLSDIYFRNWKELLLYERMEQKVEEVRRLLGQCSNDFEEVFFRILFRNFGFSLNRAAFEALSGSLPWPVILKCRQSLQQTEALLLGQSGLLEKAVAAHPGDNYLSALNAEYHFLRKKYGLTPVSAALWKWLRLRPDNFPELRIAQLSAFLADDRKLFRELSKAGTAAELLRLLEQTRVSEYWQHHIQAGRKPSERTRKPGKESLLGLIINTVIPVMTVYADYKGDGIRQEQLMALLDQLPAENNLVVRKWKEAGIRSNTAADSQALLQLYRKYCEPKNCLRCRIGYRVLTIESIKS